MSTRLTYAWLVCLSIIGTLIFAAPRSVEATTAVWNKTSGGDFGVATNWQNNHPPASGDLAEFQTSFGPSINSYSVTFSSDVTTAALQVSNYDVPTFHLNGHTYNTTVTDSDSLSLYGDGFTLDGPGHLVSAGQTYMQGGVIIRNGANMSLASLPFIAVTATNFATIDGAGSTLTINGTTSFSTGNGAASNITASNGGLFSTGASILGMRFSALVTGSNSTWNASSLEVNQGLLTVAAGGTLNAGSQLKLTTPNSLTLHGGAITATTIDIRGSSLPGYGSLTGKILSDSSTALSAVGGDMSLGDSSRLDAFVYAGTLDVGSRTVTLNAASYATLGSLTTLGAGTLAAPNGVTVPTGNAITGSGSVQGAISTNIGATIQATGTLQLGDAAASDGVFLGGRLLIGTNTVTLNDSNQAVLGSLTQVGNGGNSGTLIAANGVIVDTGNNLVGQGTVNCTNSLAKASIVNGSVQGTGTGLNFTGYVKGVGTYTGTVTFSGTYSPGLSPASVQLENMNLTSSSVLDMEIGGLSAGSQYDRLTISGAASLAGTLDVTLINGFTPALGDSFLLIDGGTLTGSFANVNLPQLTGGRQWVVAQNGSDYSVTVVPEPAVATYLVCGIVVFSGRRRSRRVSGRP